MGLPPFGELPLEYTNIPRLIPWKVRIISKALLETVEKFKQRFVHNLLLGHTIGVAIPVSRIIQYKQHIGHRNIG